jgi:glycosyl transferase family 25
MNIKKFLYIHIKMNANANSNLNANAITCIEDIKHIFYINLDHRLDRKEHVEAQLNEVGLKGFQRFNAIKMENGAVGCSMSHLKLLQTALKKDYEHILILEDDITFLDPELFKTQINTFFKEQSKKEQLKKGSSWDVVLIAGNNMPPYQKIDDTCIKVTRCQTTTGYLVNGHYIEKLMNNVKMGLTNLLNDPTKHTLYAIDKFWFALQETDNWFLITPLTVVQREDYSDIEKKVINYQSIMTDLDKKELFEKIRLYKEEHQRKQEEYNSMMARFHKRMNLY